MRLINADSLISSICGEKCGCEPDECGLEEGCCDAVKAIKNHPTYRNRVYCFECAFWEGRRDDGMIENGKEKRCALLSEMMGGKVETLPNHTCQHVVIAKEFECK